jgi:aquaporin Z
MGEIMKGLHQAFFSELVGTGLLVAVGLSVVIVLFGTNSALIPLLPNPGARRMIAGFLFGTTGALIAVSRIGKISGAHINPAVTLGFWILGKINGTHAATYMVAQFAGAVLGAIPLLLWGAMGKSIEYGAALPGPLYGIWIALTGEIITTFALIIGLFVFLGHKRLSAWTPLLFPFLYAIMVYFEAPISGTSTNPARTLGPAVISDHWHGWWIYIVGPITGTWIATVVQRHSLLKRLEIGIAKVYHFKHDPHGIFHVRR